MAYFASRLKHAREVDASCVVVIIDSPGGSVPLGKRICNLISDYGSNEVVGYVRRGENGALSAAAWVCFACGSIYMEQGTVIGAATPYRLDPNTGSAEIDEKMVSIFRSELRACADQNGHPAEIAEAMVDRDLAVAQVEEGGKTRVVSLTKAMFDAMSMGGHPQRIKRVISRPGKVLTLTANEALACGVATGIVGDFGELLRSLGRPSTVLDNSRATELGPQRNRQTGLLREINVLRQKVGKADPSNYKYQIWLQDSVDRSGVIRRKNEFADGGQEWKKRTNTCLRGINILAQKLDEYDRFRCYWPELGWSDTAEEWKRLRLLRQQLANSYNNRGL